MGENIGMDQERTATRVAIEFTGTATLAPDASPTPGAGADAFAAAIARVAGGAIECRSIKSVTLCVPTIETHSATTTWTMTTTDADGNDLATRRAALEEIRTSGGLRHKLTVTDADARSRQIGIFELRTDAEAIVEAWKDGLLALDGIVPPMLRTA